MTCIDCRDKDCEWTSDDHRGYCCLHVEPEVPTKRDVEILKAQKLDTVVKKEHQVPPELLLPLDFKSLQKQLDRIEQCIPNYPLINLEEQLGMIDSKLGAIQDTANSQFTDQEWNRLMKWIYKVSYGRTSKGSGRAAAELWQFVCHKRGKDPEEENVGKIPKKRNKDKNKQKE
jgi:hypothetical protein